jgi:archaemetzincin
MTNEIPAANPPRHGLIAVLPLGLIDEDVLRVVADSLQGLLRLPVDLLNTVPLPPESFMESRNQYNAMTILKYLDQNHSHKALKTLAVTSRDLANPILTYVYGEAYMGGSAAVMSCARLSISGTGRLASREQFLDRVVKVAIHEVGHTFSIPHCHNGRCVMRASNNLPDLDEKLNYLCNYCEIFLADSLKRAFKKEPAEE